jgi:hypothetical protein
MTVSFMAGFNVTTEAYSVFKAESQNHADPSSGLNKGLLFDLNSPGTKVH